MYLYVELWKPKPAWRQLPPDRRQQLIDELLALAKNHPVSGVIPVSVKTRGNVVLLDGVTETPAVIDDAASRPSGFRYVAAWLIPTLELVRRFERRAEPLGWWFEYFEQINAWGVMDPRMVLGDMLGQAPPPPVEEQPSPPSARIASQGNAPGQRFASASADSGELSWCPPGSFAMGREGVQVTLRHGFWMARQPVTQRQFKAVLGRNPSSFRGPSLPVESLGKSEAKEFCRELTRREREAGRLPQGWQFDLPTEAQWEYSCRAGTTSAYYWGEEPSAADLYAWYSGNSGEQTRPVGQKQANAWGLHDTLGNVLEFCRDMYRETLPGGLDPLVTTAGSGAERYYVARGGGWFFDADGLKVALRSRLGTRDQSYLIGFRIALVPDEGDGEGGRATDRPDLNSGRRSFDEVQGLIDRAAWIHSYVDPIGTPTPIPSETERPAGHVVELAIRRFLVDTGRAIDGQPIASNRVGEQAGRLTLELLAAPHDYVAGPDRRPRATPWTPERSQRVVLQQATFRFGGGQDGFDSFGTGRTFPIGSSTDGGTEIAAIGSILRGFGRFRGFQGIYVLSGETDAEGAFRGSVMLRVVDPLGEFTTEDPIPALADARSVEADTTYLTIRSRKSGPEQKTTYNLSEPDEVRGLDVPQTLFAARTDFAVDGARGLRSSLNVGDRIGEEKAVVAVNPLQPDSQPATDEAPARFQGVGEYVFYDSLQRQVGGFTAQFLEGRTVNMTLEGAPDQPASRFGFFGPILEGYGCFKGAEGTLLGSTGVGLAPHVLSNLYVLRLRDPEARFRRV